MDLRGEPVVVGASIGAAVTPDDGTDFTSLLHTADQRMYAAKHTRRPPRPRTRSGATVLLDGAPEAGGR